MFEAKCPVFPPKIKKNIRKTIINNSPQVLDYKSVTCSHGSSVLPQEICLKQSWLLSDVTEKERKPVTNKLNTIIYDKSKCVLKNYQV